MLQESHIILPEALGNFLPFRLNLVHPPACGSLGSYRGLAILPLGQFLILVPLQDPYFRANCLYLLQFKVGVIYEQQGIYRDV